MTRTRGINVHRFAEGLGLRILPPSQAKEPRPPNVLYGGRTIARMLRKEGPVHTGLVLSCIQAADPTCFYGDTIWAVSRFLAAHEGTVPRVELLATFRGLDLSTLRERAKRAAAGKSRPMARRADALATMIWNSLQQEAA